MKNVFIIFIIFLIPLSDSYSQRRGSAAAAAGAAIVGGVAAGISYSAIRSNLEEKLENTATEWVLTNDTITDFKLSLIRFEGVSDQNFQNVRVIPFVIQPKNTQNSYILLSILSSGWQNDFGLDVTRVSNLKITKKYWLELLKAYLNLGGVFPLEDIFNIQTYIKVPAGFNPSEEDKKNGRFVYINKYSSSGQVSLQGLSKTDYTMSIENLNDIEDSHFQFFRRLEGNKVENGLFPLKNDRGEDSHLILDYDDNFKLDFTEYDLNFFYKKTNDLFKLKRKVIIDITRKLFSKER